MAEELRQGNITDEELADQESEFSDEMDANVYDENGYLLTPSINPLEQYDLQDPAHRRRRTGRMPPQLARYWKQYDPRRRRRGRARRAGGHRRRRRRAVPMFHPAMRRRRRLGGYRRRRRMPTFHMPKIIYHRRRHDPAIMLTKGGAFWGAILQPIVTTIGGMFHNAIVARYPKVAGGVKVGNGAVGYLGLAGGALGAGLDLSGRSMFGSMANAFGSGMLSEAVNVPGVEAIATVPTQRAYMKSGMGGMAGPRLVQALPSMQPGTF